MKNAFRTTGPFIALSLFSSSVICAQQKKDVETSVVDTLYPMEKVYDPLIIEATRAHERIPVAYTDLNESDIRPLNNGQDMPYLFRFTPSLVVTSDAGNGVGYTGLWIRGSDPSRVNVTINGVPLNDPESQQVFWVNTPDFISSADKVQIQRGVGTSANGVAAFGGLIKIESTKRSDRAFGEVKQSFGSFNTRKHTISLGTGRIGKSFSAEGRLSRIASDGYIDRARTDLSSFYVSGGWKNEKTQLVLTAFGGLEETYQSWYGTPAELLEGGSAEDLGEFAGRNGLSETATANLLNSGRTYNFYQYDNQIDHYGQDHYQLLIGRRIREKWNLSVTGHYTRGKGYFEEYKEDDRSESYGLNPVLMAADQVYSDGVDENGIPVSNAFSDQFTSSGWDISQTVVTDENGNPITDGNGNFLLQATASASEGDVIRRRWLDNHFYGSVFSLQYFGERSLITIGGAANEYRGKHFGELRWMEVPGEVFPGDHYYDGISRKRDGNVYVRWVESLGREKKWDLYGDAQLRGVSYRTNGLDNDLRNYNVSDDLVFFNPKAGITYRPNGGKRYYMSVAVGHKEPNRNDYVDAPEGIIPRPERMTDVEAGLFFAEKKWTFGANAYFMNYKDQLVLTGALNDVGAPLRINVPQSYRAGIELESSCRFLDRGAFFGNLTVSQNRIKKFDEILYDYTNGFEEVRISHEDTPVSFSPPIVAAGGLEWRWLRKKTGGDRSPASNITGDIAWTQKYVARQHLDNTGNDVRTLGAYTTGDLRLSLAWVNGTNSIIELNVWVNNALNASYSSNGYTYSYIYEETVTERFYYPQAGRNWMLGLNVSF